MTDHKVMKGFRHETHGFSAKEYVTVQQANPDQQIWECIVCNRERVFFYGPNEKPKELLWLFCNGKCNQHTQHKFLGLKRQLVH